MWSYNIVAILVLVLVGGARFSVPEKNVCDPTTLEDSYDYNTFGEQACNCTKNCVRKCCAPGYHTSMGYCHKNNATYNFNFTVDVYVGKDFNRTLTEPDQFSYGYVTECIHMAHLLPYKVPQEKFFLQADGRLWVPAQKRYATIFCLEHTRSSGFAALECENKARFFSRMVNTLGRVISLPFLLAIMVVYAWLPKKTVIVKATLGYVTSLLGAWLFLSILNLSWHQYAPLACIIMGYLIYGFFISSFYWMNVICFDVYLTFNTKTAGWFRSTTFYPYCLYALGMTLVHVIGVYTLQSCTELSHWYNPGIGDGQCYLRKGYPRFFYFYMPMTLIIIANIVLFIITCVNIVTMKEQIKKFDRTGDSMRIYNEHQNRFKMHMRLFLVMGVNWIWEIISFVITWQLGSVLKYAFYLTDFFNATYGLVLFIILVCNKKTWKAIKDRYKLLRGTSVADVNSRTKKSSTSTMSESLSDKKENINMEATAHAVEPC